MLSGAGASLCSALPAALSPHLGLSRSPGAKVGTRYRRGRVRAVRACCPACPRSSAQDPAWRSRLPPLFNFSSALVKGARVLAQQLEALPCHMANAFLWSH